MKKVIILGIILILLTSGISLAQEENKNQAMGIPPDSPFYFFQGWMEGFGGLFRGGDSAFHEELALRRQAEIQYLQERNQEQLIEQLRLRERLQEHQEEAERIRTREQTQNENQSHQSTSGGANQSTGGGGGGQSEPINQTVGGGGGSQPQQTNQTGGGGGGQPQPTCVPKTCYQMGYYCGVLSDGCGDVLNCGSCPEGQTCSNGKCLTEDCRVNECTQTCEGCDIGKERCVNSNGIYECVECFMDLHCKSGYFCNKTTHECQEEAQLLTCGEQSGNTCSNNGCVCYGTLLESSDTSCCCQGLCNPTTGNNPQDAVKKWFEGSVEGDNNKVFANMVDIDGNDISEDCKIAYQPWITAYTGKNCEFEITSTGDCTYSVPEGIDCTTVTYSYYCSSGTSGSGSTNTIQVLYIDNQWKVQIDLSSIC